MTAPAIRCQDLGKRYRLTGRTRYLTLRESLAGLVRRRNEVRAEERWALRGLDLELDHGSVIGLIGGNGAGKSTLLKLLARITHPTTGRIELRGRVGSLLEV